MHTNRASAIGLALCACAALGQAQQSTAWRDPSNHRVQFVTVQDGVRLEVLDWGGAGRPVVLLAGYLTAHAYDDLAPKLAEFSHVYGITRRGFGASSQADSGYTADRSAEDVLQVLDALKLKAPILVGHSFGGQDMTTLAARHPGRIAGLVYLNSAEDPTLRMADYGVEPPDPTSLPASMIKPPSADHSSFQAYRDWQSRTHGVAFPESELRNTFTSNPDGSMGKYLTPQSVRQALFKGLRKPDYASIRVPVLAFFAAPRPIADRMQQHKPQSDSQRAALEQQYNVDQAIMRRHIRDLQTGIPSARVVVLPKANFYIFLSNEREIERELRAFVDELP